MSEKPGSSRQPTRNDNYKRMTTNIHRIETLADQTAVHRKKFEFALSQLRKFAQSYSKCADDTVLSSAELSATEDFTNCLQELRSIIIENLLQTWTIPTIENPTSTVLDHLHDVFSKIHKIAGSMDNEASLEIDPDSDEWIKYHILDLRAIHASFAQYKKLKDFDPMLARSIDQRLASIDKLLAENSQDDIVPRTFSPIPVNYQSWRVSITDFEEIKPIGNGVSATVFYGRDKRNNQEVAIKKFKFAKMNGSKLQSFQREVAVLATAIHPAVVRLIGATESMPFCIITEWMPNSSLYHDLHVHHHLDQTGKTIAAFDIARGMQFLHSCQIVHRDLKSLNVLLDINYHIRICDFGFSRHATDTSLMSQNIGTPHWMAPELLSTSSNYTSKIDVYAYGIVLWELATGQTPYSGMDSHYIIQQVLSNDIRPSLPPDINPAMRDLITQCWDRNPDVRPSFDEIVKKFEIENVMMNGANLEEFKKYIRESATTSENQARMVEKIMSDSIKGEIDLKTTIKMLKNVEIPRDSIDVAWNTQILGINFGNRNQNDNSNLDNDPSKEMKKEDINDNESNEYKHDNISFDSIRPEKAKYIAEYVAMFLKTSKLGEASEILRKLPRKSIPNDIISQFVEEIPTGSAEIDTNIAIAGCRNGIHDLVALYSANTDDTILALNVCSHEGVDIRLRAAIVDRCVQSLVLNNTELAAAALKCLLSIGEFKRIQFDVLNNFLTSTNDALSSCAYLAITAMAFENRFPPEDMFDLMLEKMQCDRRSSIAIVSLCKDPHLADKFLTLMEEKPVISEESLKALIMTSKTDKSLNPRIKTILERNDYKGKIPTLIEFVDRFTKTLL